MQHDWSPTDWAAFLIALGTLVNTVLIALAAFLANMAKIRGETNALKIDANTELTKAGTNAAVDNAKVAAENANNAKTAAENAKIAADDMKEQMNGGFDVRVNKIVETHIAPLVKDVQDIKTAVTDMAKNKADR